MTATAINVAALAAEIGANLRQHRSALMQETKIHAAIASVLRSMGIIFEQEFVLGPSERLDFMLPGGVAIEVKKGIAGLTELSQLGRYLDHPQVSACILVAMRCRDLIPNEFRGKPVIKIELWRMLL